MYNFLPIYLLIYSHVYNEDRNLCCHNPITTSIVPVVPVSGRLFNIIITAWTTLMLDDWIAAMPPMKLEHILPFRCGI